VSAERIVAAARLYGQAATSLIMHARGIEHSTHGVNNVLTCTSVRVIILEIPRSHNLRKKDIAGEAPGDAWWTPLD